MQAGDDVDGLDTAVFMHCHTIIRRFGVCPGNGREKAICLQCCYQFGLAIGFYQCHRVAHRARQPFARLLILQQLGQQRLVGGLQQRHAAAKDDALMMRRPFGQRPLDILRQSVGGNGVKNCSTSATVKPICWAAYTDSRDK